MNTLEHRYDPIFNDEVLTSGRFVASPHVTEFMENADYANGAMADWGTSILYLSHFRHTHTKYQVPAWVHSPCM